MYFNMPASRYNSQALYFPQAQCAVWRFLPCPRGCAAITTASLEHSVLFQKEPPHPTAATPSPWHTLAPCLFLWICQSALLL